MRSLGTRRAAQVAGVATAAVIALAGCSAGQVAETALLQTPVSGLNTASPDGDLLIRNLQVTYDGTTGYPMDGTAPLEVSLFNQTQSAMTVTITSSARQAEGQIVVAARQIGLLGTTPSATAASEPVGGSSATPSEAPNASQAPRPSAPVSGAPAQSVPAAPAQPAQVTIPALGSVSFRAGDPARLAAIGLSGKLVPGSALALTFQVAGSTTTLDVLAPVAIPLSAPARGSGVPHENVEE